MLKYRALHFVSSLQKETSLVINANRTPVSVDDNLNIHTTQIHNTSWSVKLGH